MVERVVPPAVWDGIVPGKVGVWNPEKWGWAWKLNDGFHGAFHGGCLEVSMANADLCMGWNRMVEPTKDPRITLSSSTRHPFPPLRTSVPP